MFPPKHSKFRLFLVYTFGVSFLFSQGRQKGRRRNRPVGRQRRKGSRECSAIELQKEIADCAQRHDFFFFVSRVCWTPWGLFLQACVLKAFGLHLYQLFNARHMNVCNSTWRQPKRHEISTEKKPLPPEDETSIPAAGRH